ncbi:MAG: DUF480 domain-containing protein, partial [Acidobacteriota bacterium]
SNARESRYAHLLGGDVDIEAVAPERADRRGGDNARLDKLETEVAALREEMAALRELFEKFRQQFE